MLYALSYIQEMSYHRGFDRSDANIWHFYQKSLEFAAIYSKLFKYVVLWHQNRRCYASPIIVWCHTCNMATVYISLSLKAVVVVAKESQFHDVK